MKNIVLILIAFCFMLGCHSEKRENAIESEVVLDSMASNSKEIEVSDERVFIDFPIPELDAIFPYFETSGAVSDAPSARFYNPIDSGIFVFYSLFDKPNKGKKLQSYLPIGTLITHTYRKPGYGWSEEDKDQTFILLNLNEGIIKIGKSIQIGSSYEDLTKEIGEPIYQNDSSFVFLGKNKVVGQFDFKNGQVESLIYGRFNLGDEVFDMDSASLKVIIEEKLKPRN